MEKPILSHAHIMFATLLGLCVTFFLFIHTKVDPRTIVVFCDVGQGDAAYIRIHDRLDILIDAGPDNKVIDCLSKYMPFYDHTIEAAFLSHPQKDHFGGYISILKRYKIKEFISSPLQGQGTQFKELMDELKKQKVTLRQARGEEKIFLDSDTITLLWPSAWFLDNNLDNKNESKKDPNYFSLVFVFQERYFRALFSGDAPPTVFNILSHRPVGKINIIKIPHHGSENGLTKSFLFLAEPSVAVISVGKNNRYGFPSKTILDLLKAKGVVTRRTDKEDDIVFRIE